MFPKPSLCAQLRCRYCEQNHEQSKSQSSPPGADTLMLLEDLFSERIADGWLGAPLAAGAVLMWLVS
jgi:hypothetical protein